MRRGSPLPIPNREVKPACADGTAICGRVCHCLFLVKPRRKVGVFFFWWQCVGRWPLFVAFFRESLSEKTGFLVLFKVQHSLFNIQNFKRLNGIEYQNVGAHPCQKITSQNTYYKMCSVNSLRSVAAYSPTAPEIFMNKQHVHEPARPTT